MYSTNRTSREQTLPAVVQRHLSSALGDIAELPVRQRIYQQGAVRLSPTSPWRPFRATETVDLISIALRWAARIRLAPLTWLQVSDECSDDAGSLRSRLWGRFPMHSCHGDDVQISQSMRYLAELAWAPHAMLGNTRLRWREITENRVEVSTRVRERRICARLGFDQSGRLTSAHVPDRPMLIKGRAFRTPWHGTFESYAKISGIWLPAYAEAAWQLPDGPFTYWRGTVTGVDIE